MKYPSIEPAFFIQNRKNFIKQLKSHSIAVFNANDEFPRNGDQNFSFRQNSDLFYLTGIEQEKTILVLAPENNDPQFREIIFALQTDEHQSIWYGAKLSNEEIKNISGISAIFPLDKFNEIFEKNLINAEFVYLNSNENSRFSTEVPYRDQRFAEMIQNKYPIFKYESCAPILAILRPIKSSIEIKLMSKACDITEKAFRRVLKMIKPGLREYEIEAEIIYEFIRYGAEGHAFQPIVASGINATCLHYSKNDQVCKNGDLLLLDFGAEYANYPADLSRTIPVNGRFSKRQKQCYNAILKIQKQAKEMLVAGTSIDVYHANVCELMEEEMIGLGLFTLQDVKNQDMNNPLYKKYFMHGTSHFIGLDVHDLGSKQEPLKPGMVLSCEPGIYIKEEGIGIRLENDILITETGQIDLLSHVPIEPEEIEDLINSK